MMTKVFGTDESFEPLHWLLVYVFSVLMCIQGGRSFWIINRILAVVSVLIVLLYITSSLPFVDFNKHSDPRWFVGGVNSFLQNIVSVLWFFIGIEFVNNGTKDCNNPLKAVPLGYVTGILTLLVTGIGIVFVSISLQSWESLTEELDPLNVGFCRAFSCGPRVALIFALPAVFATNFGFIFAFGRILYSLGQANIFPSMFGKRLVSNSTPDVALVMGSLMGFGFSCLYKFAPFPKPELFHFCGLASCFTYCTLLGSYVVFSSQFSHLTSSFRSIFGVIGAICSLLIFLVVWVSIAAFQHSQVTFYYFLGFFLILSLYYYFVVRHHQYFCSEEQDVLFKTYVTKCKFFSPLLSSLSLLSVIFTSVNNTKKATTLSWHRSILKSILNPIVRAARISPAGPSSQSYSHSGTGTGTRTGTGSATAMTTNTASGIRIVRFESTRKIPTTGGPATALSTLTSQDQELQRNAIPFVDLENKLPSPPPAGAEECCSNVSNASLHD
jgi:amino acid permease